MNQNSDVVSEARLRVAKLLASAPLKIRGIGALTRWIAGTPACRKQISLFGYRFELHLENHIDRDIYLYGSYSPEELAILDCLTDFLRTSGCSIVYYDVGANIGHHSLFMASRAKKVYSFEPFAPVADRLRDTLSLNNIQNVTLFRVALSDNTGTQSFAAPVQGNSGTGRLVSAGTLVDNSVCSVAVTEGAAFTAKSGLEAPSIVKIDVEGHELSVLSGLASLLNEHQPFVLIELSRKTSEIWQRDASALSFLDFANSYRIIARPSNNEVLLERGVVPGENMYLFVPTAYESQFRRFCAHTGDTFVIRFA